MAFPPIEDCDLLDRGVLVTRAAHQSASLCQAVDRQGGRPFKFPAVEIAGPVDQKLALARLGEIGRFDIGIFISPNAVEWTLKLLGDRALPETMEVAAIGESTAQTLAESGYPVDIVPSEGFDSEALLNSPGLRRVEGRRIAIFRGNGGRGLLQETLSGRGAEVQYIEVYQRVCPNIDSSRLLQRWEEDIQIVTVTSSDLLDNLFSLLGEEGAALLQQTPLVVVSDRMRTHARELGCRQVILSRGAGDRALIQAICEWLKSQM